MPPARTRLICAAVILLLIVVIVAIPRAQLNDRSLDGFWSGAPDFLEKADLGEMYLRLEPPQGGVRDGYLVMVGADGTEVSNQAVEVAWTSPVSGWASALRGHFGGAPVGRGVTIAYDDEAVMPERLSLTHDPVAGTLLLHDGETLYARLVRDNETSAAMAS